MKRFLVGLAVLAMVAFGGNAYAGNNNNQNNSDTYNTTNNNQTYNQGGQGGKGGDGGNAMAGASAIAGGGSAHVDNENVNKNKNTNENKNVNKNTNMQGQGQAQGQIQGQAQGQTQSAASDQQQKQSQSANNEGNTQATSVSITQNIEDKRELIGPVGVPMVDPKLSSARAGTIKTAGSLWDNLKEVTVAQVDAMLTEVFGPKADVVVRAVNTTQATDTVVLSNGATGEYLATIYAVSKGADMIALEALAIKEAMRIGGTHVAKVAVSAKVVSEGSSVGVGVGGGASMFAHDDTVAIAPSGGFGWGSASASNEALPQAVFTVYLDKSVKKAEVDTTPFFVKMSPR